MHIRLTLIMLPLTLYMAVFSAAQNREETAVVLWDHAVLQGIRDTHLGAPMAARALAAVHTCMYDAWAAYDARAIGTQLRGSLRRPASEQTSSNKEESISYAAYRALVDFLPSDQTAIYAPLMKQLGYDPGNSSTDIETPAGIGNVACGAVLEYRHHDKSNQLGELAQGLIRIGPDTRRSISPADLE